MGFPVLALSLAANLSVTPVDTSNGIVPLSLDEQHRRFSAAGCACRAPLSAALAFPSAQSGLPDRSVELWIGTDCGTQDATRDQRCKQVGTVPLSALADGSIVTFDLTADQILFPVSGACTATSGTSTVFALLDEDGDGQVDDTWHSDPVTWDAQPPPAPTGAATVGSENAVKVSWTPPSSTSDVNAYQILCAHADGTPLGSTPAADPIYRVAGEFASCPASVPHAGGGLAGLDPAYVCSGQIGGTANGATISVAAGSPDVHTLIVAVDLFGNATSVDAGSAGPILVRDGWEMYRDAGGAADGGYCFVATAAYGNYDHPYVRVLRRFRDQVLLESGPGRTFVRWYYRHSPPWAAFLRRHAIVRAIAAAALLPVVVVAWLWLVIPFLVKLLLAGFVVARLARRISRRRPRAAAIALVVLALGVLGTSSAHADEVDLSVPVVHRPGPTRWAFSLAAGPYHPEVDSEFPGVTYPPYDYTYGGDARLLVRARLERRFDVPYGQLALAGAIGWTSESALAWVDPGDGSRPTVRSADETSFHMVPLSLTALYYLSALADRTSVPLVPYGGFGLTWNIWWFTRDDGSVSNTIDSRGSGATLGWEAIAGLAVRLDGLDPDAMRSLERDIGLKHVSLFFEVDAAAVNGLLQHDRLHVGDTTWTAGLRFDL